MSIMSNINVQPDRKNKSVKLTARWNRLTRQFAGVIIINNSLKNSTAGVCCNFQSVQHIGF
jgi:cytochrome c-type biogenesis protein CcmH/NrfF